jgi:predicted transcriptional regulator
VPDDVADESSVPVPTRLPPDPEPLGRDELFEVLTSERRRRLLAALHEHGPRMDVTDLVSVVALAETDGSLEELDREARRRVRISLHQHHLPRMESLGIVRYDRDESVVELCSPAKLVLAYLYFDPTGWRSDGDGDGDDGGGGGGLLDVAGSFVGGG